MRSRYRFFPAKAVALFLVGTLALTGCNTINTTQTTGDVNLPSGPGGICFDQAGKPIVCGEPGSGSNGGSGSLPAGSQVRVGLFGQRCPEGTTPPNNGAREIKDGCTGFVTATPKDASGADLPSAVHGPNIAWSVPFGANLVNVTAPPEPFNRDVQCVSLGDFTLRAQVKNVAGETGFECVTNPASRTLGASVVYWTPLATESLKRKARASMDLVDVLTFGGATPAPTRWEHTLR